MAAPGLDLLALALRCRAEFATDNGVFKGAPHTCLCRGKRTAGSRSHRTAFSNSTFSDLRPFLHVSRHLGELFVLRRCASVCLQALYRLDGLRCSSSCIGYRACGAVRRCHTHLMLAVSPLLFSTIVALPLPPSPPADIDRLHLSHLRFVSPTAARQAPRELARVLRCRGARQGARHRRAPPRRPYVFRQVRRRRGAARLG